MNFMSNMSLISTNLCQKPVFYIIMRNTYPLLFGADKILDDSGKLVRGRLGFRLEFIKPL